MARITKLSSSTRILAATGVGILSFNAPDCAASRSTDMKPEIA